MVRWDGIRYHKIQKKVVSYPMKHDSRQQEHELHPYFWKLLQDSGFVISKYEKIEKDSEGEAFESTGVMIIDRRLKRVYISLSQRATLNLAKKWANKFGFELITFNSLSDQGNEIYHTNVILSICDQFVMVCKDFIQNDQWERVYAKLSEDRQVIVLSKEQTINNFACNCLEVKPAFNLEKRNQLIMSQRAKSCLDENQKQEIQKYVDILAIPIDLIETVGGGSARCMIAEIFNPLVIS